MTVKIETTDTGIELHSPYHPDLPAAAKNIGGKFNSRNKSWEFDIRDIDRVKTLADEIYGSLNDLMTIRFEIGEESSVLNSISTKREYWAFGRMIMKRAGRDLNVQLGNGVILVSGEFTCRGGSRNNPSIGNVNDIVLEIRDVSKTLVEKSGIAGITIISETKTEVDLFADFSNAQIIAEMEKRGLSI